MKPTSTATSESIRAEAEELRLGLRRACAIGSLFYLMLLAFDLYMRAALYPEVSIASCIAYRALGGGALGGGWLALGRSGWTSRRLLVLTALIVALSVAGIAGLALHFGGLANFYVMTLAFYGIAVGTFVPAHWLRMTAMLLPGAVTYYTILLVGIATSPELSYQLGDHRARSIFIATTVLVAGLSVFAIAGGDMHWRARTRLADARRLGRYRLKSLLGQGGMNEVWLAWDMTMKREVALKLLRSHHADEARRRRFRHEAQATSALKSQHTIRLFDYGANEDGSAWIVMEYLRGMDLETLVVRHGPLDPRRALHFARQAAASLAEAHERGIVHRDVKPANLFVSSQDGREDHVKLLDFGIARQLEDNDASLTLVGTIIGTPAYMAPEQLAGATADARSDVFAFGATLFALLNGRPPFESPLPGETYRARPSTPARSLSEGLTQPLPPDLERLVLRCMAPDPAARPSNGAALLSALTSLELPPWSEAEARAWWANATAPRAQPL